jgi:type IV pilus assembly protein PilN
MIRINLLAVDRDRNKRGALITPAHRITIVAGLILIGTVLVVVWGFLLLRQQSAQIDDEITKGEAQTQQLRGVLAQVQKFESRKAQLQQRVTLIEQLRRGQSGPLHVLDEISKAIPERLWLTDLVQKGDVFTLDGLTTSLTGLTDFVSNLEASAWFSKPVDIIDSQVVPNEKTGDMYKFSIKATFKNPAAPAAPVAGGPAGRGAPPPR